MIKRWLRIGREPCGLGPDSSVLERPYSADSGVGARVSAYRTVTGWVFPSVSRTGFRFDAFVVPNCLMTFSPFTFVCSSVRLRGGSWCWPGLGLLCLCLAVFSGRSPCSFRRAFKISWELNPDTTPSDHRTPPRSAKLHRSGTASRMLRWGIPQRNAEHFTSRSGEVEHAAVSSPLLQGRSGRRRSSRPARAVARGSVQDGVRPDVPQPTRRRSLPGAGSARERSELFDACRRRIPDLATEKSGILRRREHDAG